MDRTQPDLIHGTLDALILKAPAWGPWHGYAIAVLIRRRTDEVLPVEEGMFYPALRRRGGTGWAAAGGRAAVGRSEDTGSGGRAHGKGRRTPE